MPLADSLMPAGHELVTPLRDAVAAVEALFDDARRAVANRVTIEGRPVPRILDREQRATHGLAWLGTYVEAIRQLEAYALRLAAAGNFGEIEELLVRIGAGEYLAQVIGGISMSQGEIVRLSDLGLNAAEVAARVTPAVEYLIATGNTAARRARLVELIRQQHDATVGACGLEDTLDSIREEMRKFAEDRVVPYAQQWHLKNN
jgi:(2S)-methylsuccinyl-CoA dehydrogenase